MTWVKKKNTPEEDRFWSHVESVAERVRTSEIYSNNRVPLEGSQNHIERRCDASEAAPVQQPSHVSRQQ
jgi:hypothetical protein